MKSKNKHFSKTFFKVTITKKIIFFYVLLSFLTVCFTSLLSLIFFINFIDKQIQVIDTNKSLIKKKLEEMYNLEQRFEGTNKFEIPNINEFALKQNQEGTEGAPFKHILEDYPNYSFKFENIEGKLEYKEDSKLVYDNIKGRYFVEVTRQVNFEENVPFKKMKLSVKFSFYAIILKSLLLASLITLIILIPIILLFARTIINPISKVSKGVRDIASGNLGIKVQSDFSDELGELANSFNHMSRELHKMKRIRDDLLAVISHELRSPLGRIKGYTELLHDLKLSKSEKKSYYESIFSEIDFLNNMVGEIIEISRLELNKEQLFTEYIDLSLILDDLSIDTQALKRLNDNVEIIIEKSDDLYCEIDIQKIKRVFINIIENSIKAQATKIYLFAYREEDTIKIKIIDNGIGIPEDHLEIVFEKFYRVDKSRDRNTGGFGLGLAICRGIINEHNGKIYFVKKNDGAELIIELPFCKIQDEMNLIKKGLRNY